MDNPNYYLNPNVIKKHLRAIMAGRGTTGNPEFEKLLDAELEQCFNDLRDAYMYRRNPTLYRKMKKLDE